VLWEKVAIYLKLMSVMPKKKSKITFEEFVEKTESEKNRMAAGLFYRMYLLSELSFREWFIC
jgi:hypothetical protein